MYKTYLNTVLWHTFKCIAPQAKKEKQLPLADKIQVKYYIKLQRKKTHKLGSARDMAMITEQRHDQRASSCDFFTFVKCPNCHTKCRHKFT
jgi:hypothetical protein